MKIENSLWRKFVLELHGGWCEFVNERIGLNATVQLATGRNVEPGAADVEIRKIHILQRLHSAPFGA